MKNKLLETLHLQWCRHMSLLLIPWLLLLPALNGCGSGPGPTLPDENQFHYRSNVVPLDDSMQITNRTQNSVTLSGTLPNLEPGSVLVSRSGEGLLRKVVSVTRSRSDTVVVETSPASLEDAFSQAHLAFNQDLSASDFVAMTPVYPGVTISPTTEGRGREPLEITIDLANVRILGNDGASVELNGSASLKVGLDLVLDIDSFGVKYVRFVPRLTGQLNVSLTGSLRGSIPNKKVLLFILAGSPILVGPIVFVPQIDVYAQIDGRVEAGLELTSTASLTVSGGLEYRRGAGWRAISEVNPQLQLVPTPNFFGSFTLSATPIYPEINLKVYGVTGPYLRFHSPRFDLQFRKQTQPSGIAVNAAAIFKGDAGFKVDIWGRTLIDVDHPDAITARFNILDIFWPDNGQLNLGIQ